ncbi:serine dehydratase beta chain [Liquorilactobacillus sicerae]|uniref:serine dehydratase beta chain n=1 Tax=Liquorilactobacillus sicerae TaxID=1416943 RepID=UPI0024812CC9
MEQYQSIFDIIGPIMIGPSSSHTAGALAIGHVAYQLFNGQPEKVMIHYYESFAATHRGHGTDFAIVAGILGLGYSDFKIVSSVKLAQERGIQINFIEESQPSPIGHPNTAFIEMTGSQQKLIVGGCSVGGGKIEIRQLLYHNCQIKVNGFLPFALCPLDPQYLKVQQQIWEKIGLIRQIKIFHQQTAAVAVLFLSRNPTVAERQHLQKILPQITILQG